MGFQDQLLLNASQKYCRVTFVIDIFVLSIFEWTLKTGFTVTLKMVQESISSPKILQLI